MTMCISTENKPLGVHLALIINDQEATPKYADTLHAETESVVL